MSPDVVFYEMNSCNWNKIKTEQEHDGNFMLTLGEFINRGIQEARRNVESEQLGSTLEDRTDDNEDEEDTGGSENEDSVAPHEHETKAVDDQTQRVIRRSERQSLKPKYLEDSVLLAEEKREILLLCLNNEPKSFDEARESKEWIHACEDEIHSTVKKESGG